MTAQHDIELQELVDQVKARFGEAVANAAADKASIRARRAVWDEWDVPPSPHARARLQSCFIDEAKVEMRRLLERP